MTTTQKTDTPAEAISRPVSVPSAETVPKSTATYGEAYAVLSGVGERLPATGASANVNHLASDLCQARAAHAVCRTPLAAIRAEIDQKVTALADDAAVNSRGLSSPT